MKKYFTFFRLCFQTGIQYRAAFVTGILTQVPWGLMECLAFKAIHDTSAEGFPMEFSALVSYIWLKEAFLVLLNTWAADNDIFDTIINGGVSYELCRPLSIYNMWFARSTGGRAAAAAMKCIPILLIAFFLPRPYNLILPEKPQNLLIFLLSLILGAGVTVAFCMLVYVLAFFTICPRGLRMMLMGAVDLLAGNVIPLPFFPQPIRGILEVLPFASMGNAPFRIYSGDIAGGAILRTVGLQLIWFLIFVGGGKILCRLAERRVVIQGG